MIPRGNIDLRALKDACKALERSTSTKMLYANLVFLWDRFVTHPPPKSWWVRPFGKRPR